jgi:hypothetical protein
MNSKVRAALTVPTLGIAALMLSAGPAAAVEGSAQADLAPIVVNPVDGNGHAMVEIFGTTLSFTLAAQGLLDGSPHAAHIHFGADARHECPTAEDNNAEALEGEEAPETHLTASEAQPAYGPIVVSLTKEGDTSPDSALAVDRFAATGDFEYSRGDVQVSEDVAQAIVDGQAVVVVHGVDYDGDGTYSPADRGMSDLDPSLPGEATDPALCGVLTASQMGEMPEGGVETGAGDTAGVEQQAAIGIGAVALAGAAAAGAVAYRRRSAGDQA